MKILFWSDFYPPYRGGLEKMVQTLACGFAARGCEVTVITSHLHQPLPDVERVDGVTIHRFPFHAALMANDLGGIAAILSKVAALKRSLRPDIVHLQLQAASSFFHVRTTSAWDCPTVITVHGEFGSCRAGEATLLGALFDSAAWVSAVSQAMLDDLRNIAPLTALKSSLIYNSVEPIQQPEQLPSTGQPAIFACGRHVHDKGFDLLIAAFHQLQRDMPDARLLIAGDGIERGSLERDVEKLGIAKAVKFLGWVSDEELRREMAAAAIMVVPSRWREGFGLVALEGALLGLPLVATRVGGLSEVIEDGRTGILVSPEDPAVLSDAMLQLLRSPQRRRELGEAARSSAESRFNMTSMLDQYENMYSRVLLVSGNEERSAARMAAL